MAIQKEKKQDPIFEPDTEAYPGSAERISMAARSDRYDPAPLDTINRSGQLSCSVLGSLGGHSHEWELAQNGSSAVLICDCGRGLATS